MADEKFEIGDVVQLKSGGPEMTIAQIDSNGMEITCRWFLDGHPRREFFHPKTLRKPLTDEDMKALREAIEGAPAD